MIPAVKDVLRDMLTGDSDYLELLGNPVDSYKRTYYALPPEEPQLPIVVLAMNPNIVEPIDRMILSTIGLLTVTIWAKTNVYEQIAERIIYLYHQKAGLSTTHAIRLVLTREPEELYDRELDAYGKVLEFTMFTRRAII